MNKEFIRIIPSKPVEIKRTATEAVDFISACSKCSDDIFRIRLCVLEALANSHIHGNKGIEDKKIILKVRIENNHIVVIIKDEGGGIQKDLCFDFPDWEEEHGRGIPILMSYCDDVDLCSNEGVKLIFKIEEH